MIPGHLDELIEKYILKTATGEEQQELQDWFNTENSKDILWTSDLLKEEALVKARMLAKINAGTVAKSPTVNIWPRIAAAAAVIFVLGAAFFFHNYFGVLSTGDDVVSISKEIAPGKKSATLTLANGHKIQLSDVANGNVANEAGVSITKTANGQVVYTVVANDTQRWKQNTLSTAKGETYSIKLPDGTMVTLNAASSLKFPTTFSKLKERKVELTGEGYFVVKHNSKQPFRVQSAGQTVEDIGTEFNINSYPEEGNIKTTLIEGTAKVVAGIASLQPIILKPGQQTVLENNSMKMATADINYAVAWKNGLFSFKDANIQTVMQQMSRWYNFDVEYQGEIPTTLFTGEIHRDLNASQVFKLLDFYKVSFVSRGKKIIVRN